jgi:hypothetical protein
MKRNLIAAGQPIRCVVVQVLVCVATILLWTVTAAGQTPGDPRVPKPRAQVVPRAPVLTPPTAGGEDITITEPTSDGFVDVAQNGDIFVGSRYAWAVTVYRSTDMGTTWEVWGSFGTTVLDMFDLQVIEGSVDRVFVLWRESKNIMMSFADANASSPSWTTQTVLTDSPAQFIEADLDHDAFIYNEYYLYLIGRSTSSGGTIHDVWFARSITQGTSWETPYRIAPTDTIGEYKWTNVSYGHGTYIHAAWTEVGSEEEIVYRRADNFAGSGIASWDPGPVNVTTSDGYDQTVTDLAASKSDSVVVLVMLRSLPGGSATARARVSHDHGQNWLAPDYADLPLSIATKIEYRAGTDEFLACGYTGSYGLRDVVYHAASAASPLTWGPAVVFSDTTGFASVPDIFIDPSRGDQVGVCWQVWRNPGNLLQFDAEWRGAPGFPVKEFYVDLGPQDSGERATAPALVDVDADPYMEIVFIDARGRLHLMSHTGVEAGGWPKDLGIVGTNAPAAVGDLVGNGVKYIVAADAFGVVYAYRADTGALADGFPVDLGTGTAAHVTIGSLGPPHLRYIIATSQKIMVVLNYAGVQMGPTWTFAQDFTAPAAVGDLDGDGTPEIVSVNGDKVYTHHLGDSLFVLERQITGKTLWKQPSLADIDSDAFGYLDIVVPTLEGDVYVISHTGANLPGWPFSDPAAGAVNEVALAQFVGTSQPDLAFTQTNSVVHLLFYNGSESPFYPQNTSLGVEYPIFDGPIIADTHPGYAGSVVTGAKDSFGWVFGNIGYVLAGWPKYLLDRCETTPAAGDIDLDGDTELVFVTNSGIVAFDLNHPAETVARNHWPMKGYNPGRTACLDCEEVVVSIEEKTPRPQQLTMTAFPNPADGRGMWLRYSLTDRAPVRIEIFDVRGRRVRSWVLQEQGPGEKTLHFDGRNYNGLLLASGQYYARLTVGNGAGSEMVVRKLNIIR